jgi:predicted choloylglycine hydrolase
MKQKNWIGIIVAAIVWIGSFGLRAEVLGTYRTSSGLGWLERSDQGDLILHLQGSYHDMGVEHAKLLGPDTAMALRSAKNTIHHEVPFLPASLTIRLLYQFVGKKQAAYVPPQFLEEMEGLAEGSGVPLRTVVALHAMTYLTSCAGAAAWGPASRDGRLYFMRSNDLGILVDPETRTAYHDRGMIVIYQPVDEIPYLMISWPGFIGASDGMNAEGIAVGNMSDPSRYETPAGLPMSFRIKQTLGKAHNLEEAIAWMTKPPLEGGYNFLVADAKIPEAKAIEMDAKTVYVGGWDGPAESNHYAYQGRDYAYAAKPGLLTRTNHPLSSELIAHHTKKIDDGQPHSKWSAERYQDLRAKLVSRDGALDLETMNEILRSHYQAVEWETGPTWGATSHQFVFDPRSGDLLIAFSKGNPLEQGRRQVSAFSQPFHRYNFFELLNRRPD